MTASIVLSDSTECRKCLYQRAFMQESVKPKLGFGILKAKTKKMNTLQELIDVMKVRRSKAQERYINFKIVGNEYKKVLYEGKTKAFDEVVIWLTDLLLKEETAKDWPECTCNMDEHIWNPNCEVHREW